MNKEFLQWLREQNYELVWAYFNNIDSIDDTKYTFMYTKKDYNHGLYFYNWEQLIYLYE